MGTKNNPGVYDCYVKAEPDEPMFVLLGRDPNAPAAVRHWIVERLAAGVDLKDPKIVEAIACAASMDAWREAHR